MDEEQNKETSPSARAGIDYAIKLSYTAVDKSDRPDKRDLLYSLVCFGCMFDDKFASDPDPVVRKHKCLEYPEPKKVGLYELAYAAVTLNCGSKLLKEMRKSWYMLFAYAILSEAPHDHAIYEKLCEILFRNEVFEDVLASRYSVYIPPTVEEISAQGAPKLLADWYSPYLYYCAERDEHNISRETKEVRRLLAAGRFDEALLRAERLLSAFPDDKQIAVSDIAARVSLSGAASAESRTALLKETLSLIDEYIDSAEGQYFRYYRGLTLLGLMDTVGARKEFTRCLNEDPSFELAALMLKGMDKYEK